MNLQKTKFKQSELGEIPEEWEVKQISDVVITITKGTTPTTFGKDYTERGVHFLKVENISDDGQILDDKNTFIDEETNQLLCRSILCVNDLLYSIAGTIGRVAVVKEGNLPANTNQALAIIRPDLSKINLDYFKYYLKTPIIKNMFLSKVVHAVQPNLSLREISITPLLYPKIEEQQKIAEILSSLDDKIELNQKINKTLEEIGQAHFKRWFMDYEFPDNNRQYKNVKLNDFIDINPTERLKKGEMIRHVEMRDLPEQGMWVYSEINKPFSGGSKFRNGDTLMARITPCLENGKSAFVNFLDERELAFGSTEFIIFRPKNEVFEEFIYYLVRNEKFRDFAIKSMVGSSGRQRVQTNAIQHYQLAFPSEDFVSRFHLLMKPIFQRIRANAIANTKLATIRDSILPRLMSGKLRVN